jgi:RND superfamily putative drug exporter
MATAFGTSVLVWQHLLGVELYWVILPLAPSCCWATTFEEAIHSGIIRSMAGSGSVVTAGAWWSP